MAVSKAKKIEQLAQLEEHLKEAKSVGFTSTTKITVAEVTSMKRDLRNQNAIFLTAKKTLIRIAFKNVYGVDLDIDTLPGQVAMVIAKEDAIAPLGIANKYANEKDWKKAQKLVFVGGYFEGSLVDADAIKKIASLPSREALLAKLLGSMMSPLSGLARFFDAAKKDLETKSLTKVGDLINETPTKTEEAPKADEVTPETKSDKKNAGPVVLEPDTLEEHERQAPTHNKNEEANKPSDDGQDKKNEQPAKTKAEWIQSPEAFEKAKDTSEEGKSE